jgi:uracil-DNA glycosylase family 4
MKPAMASKFEILNKEVTACARCPRLVEYRERIGREKRRAYMDWEYWAKPVPGFGDTNSKIVIIGLAPGAHGSNRTGRPFTGDGSGYFMYPVLHEAGFASQSKATHRDDGLKLTNAYITAVVRCAPPANKPTPAELANCSLFLDKELVLFEDLRVVVVLGKIAFDAYLRYLKRNGTISCGAAYKFGHAVEYKMPDGKYLLASYHPSMQNTNTGKLTEKMFADVFKRAAVLAKKV